MSLFVCGNKECNAIDSRNCIYLGEKIEGQPSMSLMDMQGQNPEDSVTEFGKPITFFYQGGSKLVTRSSKKGTDALMLCSECNTGEWHGEFDKVIATPAEIEMVSRCPHDTFNHKYFDAGELVEDENSPFGYKLVKKDRRSDVKKFAVSTLAMAGLIATGGTPDNINIGKPPVKEPHPLDSVKLKLAELKRYLKTAKRKNDKEAITYYKEQIASIKKHHNL